MAAVYDYVCKKCGATTELDRLPEGVMRHMVDGKVCGTFRRVWTSINVSTSNLKRARR
jgi:hypothetical protein